MKHSVLETSVSDTCTAAAKSLYCVKAECPSLRKFCRLVFNFASLICVSEDFSSTKRLSLIYMHGCQFKDSTVFCLFSTERSCVLNYSKSSEPIGVRKITFHTKLKNSSTNYDKDRSSQDNNFKLQAVSVTSASIRLTV
jgi:hypothetical protein